MRLYLVRHGDALSPGVDPERRLSEAGHQQVGRLAAFLSARAVRVARVLHSGKPRAEQTAEALAAAVAPAAVPVLHDGLSPNDPVEPLAGEIAESAEFFSFGTNDLTQTTFGISRDDAASFLGIYTARGILPADPFVSIDQQGVGELVRIGVERGRKVRPKLKVGICGEHGGDPSSVAFCHEAKLDYVSCSPFRVPIARLAAAQAALGKTAASQA